MLARPRLPLGSVLAAALALCAADASASDPAPTTDAPVLAPTTTPLDRAPELVTFKLGDAARLSLLRAYFDAEVERPGPYTRYIGGLYGRWSRQPWISLAWGEDGRAQNAEIAPAEGSSPPDVVMLPEPALPAAQEELRVQIRAEDWITRLFVVEDHATSDRGAHPFAASEGSSPAVRQAAASSPAVGQAAASSPAVGQAAASLPLAPFWTTGPSLASNGFDRLWAPPPKPVNDWRCRRRPVLFIRHSGENDRFSLVQCNGSIELGAVDRLSILARPPEVPDPGELPDEPDPDAWEKGGEWLPRVKLVNPRLLWLLQKIADAFPHRAIYIYSGYRPHKDKSALQGHHSMHGDGRAVDIQVHGVRNEALFQYCRKLDDVGCGYYPNSKFVHVDVRRPLTGHAFWIDASGPGEPSRYVDSWPGVVEHGALAWMQVPTKDAPLQGPRPRTPDDRGTADVIRK